MPQTSLSFEFYNPWSTKNSHTTQCCITMPQMVNGRKPDPVLTLYSEKLECAGYYRLGSRTHYICYTVEGSFRGSCVIQVSTTPAPGDNDWITLPETLKRYTGLETTGGAGISGGLGNAISRPVQSDFVDFTGDYAWARVKLDISQGTLQAVKYNY